MLKKILCITLLTLLMLPFASFAEDEQPVVIALAPFCDFSGCPDSLNLVMAVRDRVTADLLRNYNCVILNRSNGIVLSFEKDLETIKVTGKDLYRNKLLAADYSLTGFFSIARRTPGHAWSVDLGCTMLVKDLHTKDENDYKKVEFLSNENTCFSEDVTKEIVKALKLKPRKRVLKKFRGKINETWAVLPIKRLESPNTISGQGDKNLSMALELALQQSEKVKMIVDHSEIDKIFQELKINYMSNSTEGAAASIAKLVGADKIIMGSVSRYRKKEPELRLDLFLVDEQKAIILGSATTVCQKDDLNKKASELILNFTEFKYDDFTDVSEASDESLQNEAEVYYELLLNMGKCNFANRDLVEFSIPFIETLYLLAKNDQDKMYRIADFITYRILDDNLKLEDKKRLVKLVEKLLDKVKYSKGTADYLLTRATALKFIPERLDEAIALADEHLKKYPKFNPQYAYFIKGDCYFKRNDYEKALEFAEKAPGNYGGCRLRVKIYQILNDSSNDEKELEALNHLPLNKELYGNHLVRKLQLVRKLHGAEKAYSVLKEIHRWSKVRPEILLEIAKINIDLGNKDLAAILLLDLDSRKSMNECGYSDQKQRDELVEDIRSLKKELNIIPEKPKQLSEFYKIPSKYKFYIVPIGNPDMEIINTSITAIEIFLGCRVEVLPKIPMPDDPVCFDKNRNQYNATRVIHRVRRSIEIPEDAVAVVLITEKEIFTGNYRILYSNSHDGIKIISYSEWFAGWDKHIFTEALAKNTANSFIMNADIYNCPVNTCINSSSSRLQGPKFKNFSSCAICQKKLASKNADFVYKRYRKVLEDVCPLQRYDKQEYMDNYKKVVQEALAKTKKKVESKKTYRPAVKLDSPKPGLKYTYYEFEPGKITDTEKLTELPTEKTGIADNLSLEISKRDNYFGIIFDGYIKVPKDGRYQFYLSSGGGVEVFIGEQQILINRGQRVKSKYNEMGLKAGYHPIKILYYFNFTPWKDKNGKLTTEKFFKFMELYYRGPDIYTQKIPADLLFHKE